MSWRSLTSFNSQATITLWWASGITFSSWCELRFNTNSVTRKFHRWCLHTLLSTISAAYTFAWCKQWKQWTWIGNQWQLSPHVPHTFRKKAVSIIHECNISYVFVECQSTCRVEREDIEVDKLAFKHDWTNLFYCYTLYELNPFFCISTGLWLFNNRVFHFILWLLVSGVHGGKIKSLLNLLWKNNSLWIRPVWRTTRFRTVTCLIQVRLHFESEACLHFESGHCRNVLLHVSARLYQNVNGSVPEPVRFWFKT